MGNRKYLVRADYACRDARNGPDGRWAVLECEEMPHAGEILSAEKGPLQQCLRNHDSHSQLCEEDPYCNLQEILEVRPYSEVEELRVLAPQPIRLCA